MEDEFIARRSPITRRYSFDTHLATCAVPGRTLRTEQRLRHPQSGWKPSTKSTTFFADISHGLSDVLPDVNRYRLKLTMSVPANSLANRLLRRPSSDRRTIKPKRRPS